MKVFPPWPIKILGFLRRDQSDQISSQFSTKSKYVWECLKQVWRCKFLNLVVNNWMWFTFIHLNSWDLGGRRVILLTKWSRDCRFDNSNIFHKTWYLSSLLCVIKSKHQIEFEWWLGNGEKWTSATLSGV